MISWDKNNNTIKSLTRNNKEIITITKENGNKIYEVIKGIYVEFLDEYTVIVHNLDPTIQYRINFMRPGTGVGFTTKGSDTYYRRWDQRLRNVQIIATGYYNEWYNPYY